MLNIPSSYVDGHAKACAVDPEAADNYVRHTTIGDPELDPVMEELSDLSSADLHQFVRACIEQEDEAILRRVPQAMRDFFNKVEQVPDWVDLEAFKPGQRAFYRNMGNMLVSYALGSVIEGFSGSIPISVALLFP